MAGAGSPFPALHPSPPPVVHRYFALLRRTAADRDPSRRRGDAVVVAESVPLPRCPAAWQPELLASIRQLRSREGLRAGAPWHQEHTCGTFS